jgi:uncharacterized protein YjiS (DUF1127 family)
MREAASFIARQRETEGSGALSALLRSIGLAIRSLNSRRKLAKLSELDDHLLADIGVSREDLRWALDLPFAYDPALELQQRALSNRGRTWRG